MQGGIFLFRQRWARHGQRPSPERPLLPPATPLNVPSSILSPAMCPINMLRVYRQHVLMEAIEWHGRLSRPSCEGSLSESTHRYAVPCRVMQ